MPGELTELGLLLRRELEEMLAGPAGGWALVPALDERDDLAQLRRLEREVGALAASEVDAGQLYAWLTAGFFGEPLARGAVPGEGVRRPVDDDGEEPPSDPDGPGGGSPPVPSEPVGGGMAAPISPPPPAPVAAAPPATAAPERVGIRGLAELAAVARSGTLVLPSDDTPSAIQTVMPPPPEVAASPVRRETTNRAGRQTPDATAADFVSPRPSDASRTTEARTQFGELNVVGESTDAARQAWTPPFSATHQTDDGGTTSRGAASDARRFDGTRAETLPPAAGTSTARGLAGLAALAGSRPLVLGDEAMSPVGERGTTSERAPGTVALTPPPAPPTSATPRGSVAATAADGPTRVVRLLPVPLSVATERAEPWPALPSAEGWTPPFAELPSPVERAPRIASPPASTEAGWTTGGDTSRTATMMPTVTRGVGLGTAVAAFPPVAGPRSTSSVDATMPETGQGSAAPWPPLPPDLAAHTTPHVPHDGVPPVATTFSAALGSPAREGFGAAEPGEPIAWPDVEVGDLMDALAREIMHEYRRHYGA